MTRPATLFFEDVDEKDRLDSFRVTITRTHIVKMAGAGGDFNPLHCDEEFARSVGLPSVFAMGLMHAGFLSRVLTDWAGDGVVKRFRTQFRGMVWPHETITCAGSVVRKYRDGGEHLVDCQLVVVNQEGESKIIGDATVLLPSRSSEGE